MTTPRSFLGALAAGLALAALADTAAARSPDPLGTWSCYAGAMPVPGSPAPAVLTRFEMTVASGGRVSGSGTHQAYGLASRFDFSGRWWMQGNSFGLQGSARGLPSNDRFAFGSIVVGAGAMAAETPIQGTMSRLTTACRRSR